MPLPIRYTATNVSNSVRLGNIALGINAVDYGPSTTSGWAAGVSVSSDGYDGQYAIYYLSGTNLRIRKADTFTLTTVAGQIMGTTYASNAAALSGLAAAGYAVTSTVVPPNIVTSGSVFNVDASLIMSYPRTNSVWYDISGNAINGTLINGPTFDSVGAISFDGASDKVECSVSSLLNISSTISLEIMMYPTSLNQNSGVLCKWTSGGDTNNSYLFYLGQDAANSRYGFGVYQSNNTYRLLLPTTSYSINTWTHIVCTADGSTMRIYKNGVVDSSTQTYDGTIKTSTKKLVVGTLREEDNTYNYAGKIAFARVYNRALTQAEVTQNYYQGNIVTSSLAVALDAGNLVSYPGSGTTWYDLSGNGKDFTLVNGVTWNSAGYFTLDGIDDYISGPAGNSFSLGQEHTIEIVINNTLASTTTLFNWRSSQTDRAIMSHAPYSDGVVYYDVGGCCGVTNRISYTPSPSLTNRLTYMIFRCRTSQTPYRQVFENTVEKVNSGANATATITLSSNIALIGAYNEANLAGSGGVWKGNLYSFRMYNRALTDAEVQQNYNAMKNRYNL
jgi:hypothetical protein